MHKHTPKFIRELYRHMAVPTLMVILLLAYSVSPLNAEMTSLILASSNSPGVFSISGFNLDGPIEISVMISYQSDNPSPVQASGPFLDRKTTTLTTTSSGAGALGFLLKSKIPLNGSKLLAKANITGSISDLTAVLRYANGTSRVSQVSITNPTVEQLAEMAAQKSKSDPAVKSDTVAVTETGAIPVAVAPPTSGASQEGQSERPTVPVLPPAAAERTSEPAGRTVDVSFVPERSSSPARTREAEDERLPPITFSRRESLRTRFSALSGAHTPAALASLLQGEDSAISQEPRLQLADGSSSLRLNIKLTGTASASTQFLISGASCSGLKVGDNGAWILELVPKRGVLEASVIILNGSEAIEYPLAIVPPLELFDATSAGSGVAEYVNIANRVVADMKIPTRPASRK
jgi:hypothetical protein